MDISNQYRKLGIDNFYENYAESYQNPHAKDILKCLGHLWKDEWQSILDLACGDGLVTKWIMKNKNYINIDGCDKFFKNRYQKETERFCFSYSFEDIANQMVEFEDKYDVIVISYAIDLVKPSYLNQFLWSLSQLTNNLLIIRPNNHLLKRDCFTLKSTCRFGKAKAMLYSKMETSYHK